MGAGSTLANLTRAALVALILATASGCSRERVPFGTLQSIGSVSEYDNVCFTDMSRLDLSKRAGLPATLDFNQKTVWPEADKMPAGCNPEKLLADAMNPGLGVRDLHREGVTGKGVNVAIIDQPLHADHPEFAGKIVAYHDTGCQSESSMHGPAVASLLVGKKIGTAPEANLYYAAAPTWLLDSAYYARALDWIIEQSERLPEGKKIRVVAVSASPSGWPFMKNTKMWDEAHARARKAGILVLDCGNERPISSCSYDANDPENVAKCTPGFRGKRLSISTEKILVPIEPRTTAEGLQKGEFGYRYFGRGGLSWAIPYCAGVLAMGWQIRPDLSADEMLDLLRESAYPKKMEIRRPWPRGRVSEEYKIIAPKEFIQRVRRNDPCAKVE